MRITRKSLITLAALLAAICTVTATVALAGTAHTSARHPASAPHHQLSGTWTTTVQISDAPPGAPSSFSALDTFQPDGGLLVSSSAANPTLRSLAHGNWTHTSHRNFTSSFVWFRFDAAGQYLGTQRVRRTMKLSHNGSSFSATDVIEVIAPSGAVLATLHGTEVGMLLRG